MRRTKTRPAVTHVTGDARNPLLSGNVQFQKYRNPDELPSNIAKTRVAVLVDCDNVSPNILEHALRMVAQFGRVVLRRGYGNQGTLAHKWQEALVRLAFTPCLQYQYAAGKNTADIALALDALEALFDRRADTFCLVTSDSDFAYLCRKLRERGATVCIVGEPKTPDALRNASDQFFEWTRPEPSAEPVADAAPKTVKAEPAKADAAKLEQPKPAVKRRRRNRRRSAGRDFIWRCLDNRCNNNSEKS